MTLGATCLSTTVLSSASERVRPQTTPDAVMSERGGGGALPPHTFFGSDITVMAAHFPAALGFNEKI